MTQPCGVCEDRSSRYKCPKCLLKYCSVPCFKKHKATMCHGAETDGNTDGKTNTCQQTAESARKENAKGMETEDQVPAEKLSRLDDCDELHCLLGNPHLRSMMLQLNSSKNPEKDMEVAMQEPIFVEFADRCLKVVEPKSLPPPMQTLPDLWHG